MSPLAAIATAALLAAAPRPAAGPPPAPAGDAGAWPADALSAAPHLERVTLERLADAAAWPKRAVAAMRLQRYRCAETRVVLTALARDPAWQARAYAIHALGLRGEALEPGFFAAEDDPRVLRTALRCRYRVDPARLERGVRALGRSARLDDKLLAAELGAASGDETLIATAEDLARKVILKMDRAQAGALSPRLAVLTGQRDMRRAHRWQQWILKTGRGFRVRPGHAFDGTGPRPPLPLIARLDPPRFAALTDYVDRLETRHVDLAICLDCTASMSGELSAAQGGIDDLMLFVGDVVAGFRIGLVAYRDKRDRFRTRGWDLTDDLGVARRHLWSLSADGGGDSREAVFPALRLAYTKTSWNPEHTRVLILVGDAPPHVGYGGQCVDLARRAAEAEITTHVIEADGEPVEHFAEIAEAGGGQCVALEDDDLLIPEVAGLTLGESFRDEFREFFATYLRLCR